MERSDTSSEKRELEEVEKAIREMRRIEMLVERDRQREEERRKAEEQRKEWEERNLKK